MPSMRFGLVASLVIMAAYACKGSEADSAGAGAGAGGDDGFLSRAGDDGGGEPSTRGGAPVGTGARSGSSPGGDSGAAGREAGEAGSGDRGGEAGAGTAEPTTIGSCSPNPCVVLASGQPYPRNLIVDDEHVYWTNEGTTPKNHVDAAVMKVSLGGGDATVVSADASEPIAITSDGEYLYWTTGNGATTLRKKPIAGGAVETIATDVGVWSITLDGDYIYDTSDKGLGLLAVPVDGGTPQILYPTSVGNVVFDSENLYFTTEDTDGKLTGVARNTILVSMPRGGTDVTVLTSALDLPFAGANALVLASGSLYWSDSIRGTVETVKLDGSGRRIIASDQHSAFGLGADAKYLYWTSDRQSGVLKAPLDGSAEPVQIAKFPQKAPWGLTVDAEYIYITVYDYLGQIVKIKK